MTAMTVEPLQRRSFAARAGAIRLRMDPKYVRGSVTMLPATLFGDDPAGLSGDRTAALHGDAAARC